MFEDAFVGFGIKIPPVLLFSAEVNRSWFPTNKALLPASVAPAGSVAELKSVEITPAAPNAKPPAPETLNNTEPFGERHEAGCEATAVPVGAG